MAEEFDRSRLSQRECEILDLAIDGLTDQQIALRLSISTSTVNSYWVRIRGKLGQLSRTELVAACLRQQARNEMLELQAQTAHFEELARKRVGEDENVANAEIFRAILDAFPDPVFATDTAGNLLFVNDHLETMLGYDARELLGKPATILFHSRSHEHPFANLEAFLREPHPLRLGIGCVLYARRKDGHLVRITLAMDARPTSRGTVVTCVLRSFMEEIDHSRRRANALVESLVDPLLPITGSPRTATK